VGSEDCGLLQFSSLRTEEIKLSFKGLSMNSRICRCDCSKAGPRHKRNAECRMQNGGRDSVWSAAYSAAVPSGGPKISGVEKSGGIRRTPYASRDNCTGLQIADFGQTPRCPYLLLFCLWTLDSTLPIVPKLGRTNGSACCSLDYLGLIFPVTRFEFVNYDDGITSAGMRSFSEESRCRASCGL